MVNADNVSTIGNKGTSKGSSGFVPWLLPPPESTLPPRKKEHVRKEVGMQLNLVLRIESLSAMSSLLK